MSRQPPPGAISVRPAQVADLAVCADLIVSRTGGSADERRQRLLVDLDHPDRYTVVACDAAGQVIAYGAVIRHDLSPEHPPRTAPSGYYLIGLIVRPEWRRHGIGELLAVDRMRWTAERADTIWTFVNVANQPILDLHRSLRFEEVTRDFTFPNAPLQPGTCVLLKAPLQSVRQLGRS